MERRVVSAPGAYKFPASYSNAIRVKANAFLFIAGQVAMDEKGQLVGKGDIAAQTRQVFENIRRILAAEGATFSNLVQFTTFLVDSRDFEGFSKARQDVLSHYFPKGDFPTNTLLIIDRLALEDFLIEIEAVAAVD